MSVPKTERIITNSRTEAEKVAITLEYLASFIVWAEKLKEDELKALESKVRNLVHPTSAQNLNNFLEDCAKYLSAELSDNPGIDFDGSGVYLALPSMQEVKNETEN